MYACLYASDPQLTASEVLRVFHRDEPYLFLGIAFITTGILAAAFALLRRKVDPLLIYFALFAFFGSAQQFVRVCILRGFLESDEFGLSGSQALRLQQEIVHVSITAATAKQSFDVAVDGFHHPPSVPSSGNSSKYPRDDPATELRSFGLVAYPPPEEQEQGKEGTNCLPPSDHCLFFR